MITVLCRHCYKQGTREITNLVQYALDLRKPDLRKNLDLRKIVATTDFLVHKLFDLRKIFFQKVEKIGTFGNFRAIFRVLSKKI